MNRVKCSNGHFFDLDRFAACPVCSAGVASKENTVKSRKVVRSQRPSKIEEDDATILLEENPDDLDKALNKKREEELSKEKAEESKIIPKDEMTIPPQNETTVRPKDTSLRHAVAATGCIAVAPLDKTVSFYDFAEVEPPTGWLVCIKGAHQGQAFSCKTGKNKIGRNPDYDISLMSDNTVTREVHAIIIYEPKQRVFYLQNGNGDGLVYLNDELLFSHSQLKAYDKIQIGNAEFVFMPLCGEQFTWTDYIK